MWITFQVDAQRSPASTTTAEGVRGQTCVTNSGHSAVAEFVVVEQVMAVVNGQMTPIVGASSILHEDEKLEASATRCVDYEILFDAQPGVTYRVVAVVAPVVGGRRVAEASALLTPISDGSGRDRRQGVGSRRMDHLVRQRLGTEPRLYLLGA